MKKVNFEVKKQKIVGILDMPKKENPPAVVLVHGFKGDKDEHGRFIKTAERLLEEGFCVLRFDCRGTGESDGKFEDMTIETEVEDLLGAIDFIKTQKVDQNRIGVLGLSLGGEIAILGALKGDVKALVLWAPVTSSEKWKTRFSPEQIEELETTSKTIVYGKKTGKPWTVGKGLLETSRGILIENEMEKLKCPVLIIHGDKDDSVPLEYSKQAIERINSKKELKIVEGANHDFIEQLDEVIGLSLNWFKENV